MEALWIGIFSFIIGLVTFFSGFGLSILLAPVLMWFFPVELAVALTGLVHLTTNGFRMILLRKEIHGMVFIRFGIPALLFAGIGSWLLRQITWNVPLYTYTFLGDEKNLMVLDLLLGGILLLGAITTFLPRWSSYVFSADWLVPGGIVSGFLGGLSGLHGAFRAAFLVRTTISPATYIGTMVWISMLADMVRMFRYSDALIHDMRWEYVDETLVAILAAAASALLGKRLLRGLSLSQVQYIVGFVLLGVGGLLSLGFL